MTESLHGKHVAVGVGGGIAAYRALDVMRHLRRQGAEVRAAMTEGARHFVTPLSVQALSGHEVQVDLFDPAQEGRFGHLHLARWADLFVVVPATADLLARLHAGMGDDAVTTSLLAFRGPVLLAPAMNTAMWDHELTRRNLAGLLALPRFHAVGPVAGQLADGDTGMGRLAEVADIVAAVERLLAPTAWRGRRVLLTAGPTREPMDPVRFVSNPSTGKMGLALAERLAAQGAQVTVVLGPVQHPVPAGVTVERVQTAEEMLAAVLKHLPGQDCVLAAAAVSDWRPAQVAPRKEKKSEGPVTVTLERTPDILSTVSRLAHEASGRRPLLVGFAAETHEVLASAREKLERKRLDAIVANDVSAPGAGFASETNTVTLLTRQGASSVFSGTKLAVADELLKVLEGLLP